MTFLIHINLNVKCNTTSPNDDILPTSNILLHHISHRNEEWIPFTVNRYHYIKLFLTHTCHSIFMAHPIMHIFNILFERVSSQCTGRHRFVSTDDLLTARTNSSLQVLTMSFLWTLSSYDSRKFKLFHMRFLFLCLFEVGGMTHPSMPQHFIKNVVTVEVVFVMLPGHCQSNLTKVSPHSPQENCYT